MWFFPSINWNWAHWMRINWNQFWREHWIVLSTRYNCSYAEREFQEEISTFQFIILKSMIFFLFVIVDTSKRLWDICPEVSLCWHLKQKLQFYGEIYTKRAFSFSVIAMNQKMQWQWNYICLCAMWKTQLWQAGGGLWILIMLLEIISWLFAWRW